MKAVLLGDRKIRITEIPDNSPKGLIELDIEVRYTGDGNVGKAIALDTFILPMIVMGLMALDKKKPKPKKRPYVYDNGTQRAIELHAKAPTFADNPHNGEGYYIGPFKTRRGAAWMLQFGKNNPHCRDVAEAERAAVRHWSEYNLKTGKYEAASRGDLD